MTDTVPLHDDLPVDDIAAAARGGDVTRLASVRPAGLELSGIVRTYSGRTVLDGVDLTLAPGSAALVSGRNGAGKTTLLRIAGGLLDPDRGSVRVYGLTPQRQRRECQRRIGFLSAGDRGLYARLTVRQNLEFWARIAMIPASERTAALERAVDAFGLGELVCRRVDRLSMGQRQRVRLAMTFLHDPALVLLDEPRTSLDQDGTDLLAAEAERLRSRGGVVVCCAPTGDPDAIRFDDHYVVEAGQLHRT
jgi:heme ABC exporter ATP-binding subunit CcmA